MKLSALRSGEANINSLRSAQVPHNINFREKKSKLKKDKKAESGASEDSSGAKSRIARFRYFEDISGYSGVRREGRAFWLFLLFLFLVLYYYKTRILTFFSRFICFVFFALWPPVTAGVHLRPIAALDAGHVQRSHEASPHEHRRRHRVFLALP